MGPEALQLPPLNTGLPSFCQASRFGCSLLNRLKPNPITPLCSPLSLVGKSHKLQVPDLHGTRLHPELPGVWPGRRSPQGPLASPRPCLENTLHRAASSSPRVRIHTSLLILKLPMRGSWPAGHECVITQLYTDNRVQPHFLSQWVPLPGALGSRCTVTQLYTQTTMSTLTSCPGQSHFRGP